jgi:phospholipid/cholesterol/gamma-HCH transport system ATP-binding protein
MAQRQDRPIIEIEDLTVGFGSHTVLDRLSLDVNRGEIIGLVGGSGSGKTVLLRTIIGLLPRLSGAIRIRGQDLGELSDDARRVFERGWGVLFQQGALFSSLSVKENVQFPMREHLDLDISLMDAVAITKLAMVGLQPGDAGKFPSELSGGMTKRAALARALALDPEILFLDEPTSGLDPISAGDFDALIKTLQTTLGFTVFMITHDLESLRTVCDRVAVLVGGKIVAIGTIAEVMMSDDPWVRSYFEGRGAHVLGQRGTMSAH